MTRLLVNSHGGYDASIAPPMFAVPAGVVVNFYCPHDQLLSNDDSWRVLNHRRNFLPGDPAGIIQRNAGTVIPNYYALPYDSLGVNSGIDREIVGRRGAAIFENILTSAGPQSWGVPAPNTIQTSRRVMTAVHGGAPYARSTVLLSDIVNCPGVTEVDWIACREQW